MPSQNPPNRTTTFLIIWLGQVVSLVGSGLTSFALGVWVFERTGSATQFALIGLSAVLPRVLLSPLAGAIVDRFDRRRVMILGDLGAGLSTLVVVLLLYTARLEIWHIYLLSAVSAAFGTVQWPAFAATTSLLVSKKNLGRANGMVQFGLAASEILAPAMAGVLVGLIQLEGVILIDVVTFVFAVGTLLLVVPVDTAFLAAAVEETGESVVTAILAGDTQTVLASSAPEAVVVGNTSEKLSRRFVLTYQSFQHYEGSEFNLQFTTLVRQDYLRAVTGRVAKHARNQRATAALVFILVYSLLFMVVSNRLSRALKRLAAFSQSALGFTQPARPGGTARSSRRPSSPSAPTGSRAPPPRPQRSDHEPPEPMPHQQRSRVSGDWHL